ncbi:hypothetical protein SAMN05421595_2326 [Austwickia chelonae]|uniref:Uncharacterized protein n=1 Tax=Austwickia chelonae NBRC 105200 TaxID=1184607 RepID=K6WA12_9MICO|nr:hypothetical protein [Austwickia chelonae]GAB78672.1 hypothetical protein AUCHE_16_00910 [Austwickia chelonae NBRC 105200]SEW34587.1 hypothetical protein SAMN05421595_2326 [Austwickia chelonae]
MTVAPGSDRIPAVAAPECVGFEAAQPAGLDVLTPCRDHESLPSIQDPELVEVDPAVEAQDGAPEVHLCPTCLVPSGGDADLRPAVEFPGVEPRLCPDCEVPSVDYALSMAIEELVDEAERWDVLDAAVWFAP